MKNMKKRTLTAAALLLAGAVGIGSSMAYFTESDTKTNVFTLGDLDIGLEEPDWDPEKEDPDGEDLYPGYTVYKNPTIKNLSSDKNGEEPCYARIIMTILDENDSPVQDKAALDLIYRTIYFDKTYTGTFSQGGKAEGLVEDRIPGYSLEELSAYPMVNPLFSKDEARSTDSVQVYNYMGKTGSGILKSGEEATLFTNIVIPTDWNQTHFTKIGEFRIKLTAECIQSSGFADQSSAFAALDGEIAKDNLQNIERN